MLKCASQATAPAKSHNIPLQNCKMEVNDIPPTFPLSSKNSQLPREVRVSDKGSPDPSILSIRHGSAGASWQKILEP